MEIFLSLEGFSERQVTARLLAVETEQLGLRKGALDGGQSGVPESEVGLAQSQQDPGAAEERRGEVGQAGGLGGGEPHRGVEVAQRLLRLVVVQRSLGQSALLLASQRTFLNVLRGLRQGGLRGAVDEHELLLLLHVLPQGPLQLGQDQGGRPLVLPGDVSRHRSVGQSVGGGGGSELS